MRVTRTQGGFFVLAFLAACASFEEAASDDAEPPTVEAAVDAAADTVAPREAAAAQEDAAPAPVCPGQLDVQVSDITMKTEPIVAANKPFEVTVIVDRATGPSTNVELLICSGSVGMIATPTKIVSGTKPYEWRFKVDGLPRGRTLVAFRADPDQQIWATLTLNVP